MLIENRGRSLTISAVRHLQQVLRHWLEFQHRITTEYKSSRRIATSCDNMLDFINSNMTQYIVEEGNCSIVTRHIHNTDRRMPEDYSNREHGVPKEHLDMKRTETPKERCLIQRGQSKPDLDDYLVDNLHAILKSQEFLFKNMAKLINILENETLSKDDHIRMATIKSKLSACTEILSTRPMREFPDNILDNIMEEEITRCRLRNGIVKTQHEINLKLPQSRGLEIILDKTKKEMHKQHCTKPRDVKKEKAEVKLFEDLSKHKKDVWNREVLHQEVLKHSLVPVMDLQKKTEHEAIVNEIRTFENLIPKPSVGIDEKTKLEARNHTVSNIEHILKVRSKFLALEEDVINSRKCAFNNKRHFLRVEAQLAKKLKQDLEISETAKLILVNETMFQIVEAKRLYHREGKLIPVNTNNFQQVNSIHENSVVKDDSIEDNKQTWFVRLQQENGDENIICLGQWSNNLKLSIKLKNFGEVFVKPEGENLPVQFSAPKMLTAPELAQSIDDKNVININQKVFEDFEATMRKVHVLTSKESKGKLKPSLQKPSLGIKEQSTASMSTNSTKIAEIPIPEETARIPPEETTTVNVVNARRHLLYNKLKSITNRPERTMELKEKRKEKKVIKQSNRGSFPFNKSGNDTKILKNEDAEIVGAPVKKIEKPKLRTTKAAIVKKQTVVVNEPEVVEDIEIKGPVLNQIEQESSDAKSESAVITSNDTPNKIE